MSLHKCENIERNYHMFGKLVNYEVKGQIISFKYEKLTTRVEVISDEIINEFLQKVNKKGSSIHKTGMPTSHSPTQALTHSRIKNKQINEKKKIHYILSRSVS